MIELFTADTPNGKKISIMLEEIGYAYKVTKVDLGNNDQFKSEFIKISPFSKIPVITDHDNNESIFESGAILMYLGEKSGKFYDKQDRLKINQWLMAQMGTINRQIKLISEIDKALARIREDTYGYCLDTAEPIGLKRLMARPVAKYTIAAQEKHEKDEKVHADD